MAREAAQLVSLLSQPTPLRHDVGAQPEDTMMLMRSVRTGERAQSLRMIAQAKAQAVAVELIRRHIVLGIEDDVAQRLGKRAQAPFTVLIEPLDVSRRIHLVGSGHDGTLVPDPQTKRNAVIRHRVGSAVRIPANLAVALHVGNQFLQILARIYSPNHQLHAVAVEPIGNAAVGARAHHQTRSGGNLENALASGVRNRSKTEVVPETRARLHVIDTVGHTFDTQDGQNMYPLRSLPVSRPGHSWRAGLVT